MTKRKNKSTIAEVPSRYRYGIKALTAYGTTENNLYGTTAYILPRPDQKWGDVMQHPTPADPDGKDCGAGRYHVWKKLTKEYAPKSRWFWLVRYKPEDIVGESDTKVSVRALQLRRIDESQFHKLIRRGWARDANLRDANLTGADLRGANLRDANLRDADLKLCRYNLSTIFPEAFDPESSEMVKAEH